MMKRLLLDWFSSNRRDLPWRATSDPYKIWVSEVILQQTRIVQGLSYYLRFIERFPDIITLALASEDEVLKYWQGLGYYSRARNMHSTAQFIAKEYDGVFPKEYKKIKALKGIGDYTAAAIASIAFKEPYAVVDGNVYRVLSRIFEIETPIDSTKGKKEFYELAQELLDPQKPDLYNQAIMDLGATVCLPTNPLCDQCPLQAICQSLANNHQTKYPIKLKKLKQRNRYFAYCFIHEKEKIYLHRRDKKDIWEGLYEFPLIELKNALWEEDFSKIIEILKEKWEDFTIREITIMPNHILSHQVIHSIFIELDSKLTSQKKRDLTAIDEKDLSQYAIPRLLELYLEKRCSNNT